MADEEIATRAPESDANADIHTESTIPVRTSTNENASADRIAARATEPMSDHCTTDRPLPSSSATRPLGDFTTLNSVECYVSKPHDYPHAPSKLLLLLSGGTGIHSVNNRLQADAFAARGFLVVMPDQFGGDPAPKTATVEPTESSATYGDATLETGNASRGNMESSLIGRLKLGVSEVAKSFMIDMWLARHDQGKVMPILQSALEGAKEEFADAVANGGGIYGVGYCFGAKYILLLCGSANELPNSTGGSKGSDVEKGQVLIDPELRAGAIAHGTLIALQDIGAVKSPIFMACVENDTLFTDEVREQGRASLETNAVEHDIKVFQAVPHGFAVLGDYADKSIQRKQKEAFEMMSGWLESH